MVNDSTKPSAHPRRNFLRQTARIGVGLAATSLVGCATAEPTPPPRQEVAAQPQLQDNAGCCLVGAQAQQIIHRLSTSATSGNSALLHSSGNTRFDSAFGMMLAQMARILEVRPGFAFYDDGALPNALALRQSYLSDTQGTVLLGRGVLHTHLTRNEYGDMPIMAICAHEFAHIVQYNHNSQARLNHGQVTVKRTELHADFLAGYFLGRSSASIKPKQLLEIGQSWEGLGDNNFTDTYHHGTREERLGMIEAGFGGAHLPLWGAIEAGMNALGA